MKFSPDSEIQVSETAQNYARLPYRIEWQKGACDDTPCFVVRNPEFAGCMADGATLDEAVAHLHIVRAEFIQVLIDAGAPIPLPMPSASLSPGIKGVQSISVVFPHPNGQTIPLEAENVKATRKNARQGILRPFSYQTASDILGAA